MTQVDHVSRSEARGALRPSFILFVTDQQRADHLGCYGHPVLRTPAIDGLARHGVRYDACYVASPVCMPNRASLMTGRMPSVHGVRMNGIALSTDQVTFVDLLRDAGYRTALIGKSHLRNFTGRPPYEAARRRPARSGFHRAGGVLAQARRHDFRAPVYRQEEPSFWSGRAPRVTLPFYGFDHVDLVTGHGDACGGDYGRWLREQDPDVERRLGAAHQLPHDYVCPQAVRTALPERLYSTTYIAQQAAAWLDSVDDAPFFLMVSFPDPHHPFNPPGRYWDAYRPEDMPVPAVFERDDWTPPPHVRGVHRERAEGAAVLRGMNSIGCTLREALEARALTCGMIEMIDDAVAHVLAALERSGRSPHTVVAFTSDHGDHLGDHGLLFKGAEQYREITRVPFIWVDPEGPSGVGSDGIVQTIDLSATILERARIEPFAGLQGRSLLTGATRDAAFIQYDHQRPGPGLGGPPRVHSIVERDWRLSVFHGQPWGELYALGPDPGELHNRWGDPTAVGAKMRLLERLVRAEIEAVDRSPLPTARA